MDISNPLALSLRFLIKERSETAVTVTHLFNDSIIRVNAAASVNEMIFRGTGVASNIQSAFIKAAMEVGEDILYSKLPIDSSTGLAGGFMIHTASRRAKSEALERDAFLYHYRSRAPFKLLRKFHFEGSCLFEFSLSSADSSTHVCLVTDEHRVHGNSECIIFGLGASENQLEAAFKALGEYLVQKWNHDKEPNRCRDAETATYGLSHADFHHRASRDSRNRKIFSSLCVSEEEANRRSPIAITWNVSECVSPLFFTRYVYAESPELLKLKFRVPEVGSPSSPPLFFPFW